MSQMPPPGSSGQSGPTGPDGSESSSESSDPWQNIPPAPWEEPSQQGPNAQSGSDSQGYGSSGQPGPGASDQQGFEPSNYQNAPDPFGGTDGDWSWSTPEEQVESAGDPPAQSGQPSEPERTEDAGHPGMPAEQVETSAAGAPSSPFIDDPFTPAEQLTAPVGQAEQEDASYDSADSGSDQEYEVAPYPAAWPPPSPYGDQSNRSEQPQSPSGQQADPAFDQSGAPQTGQQAAAAQTPASYAPSDSESTQLAMQAYGGPPPAAGPPSGSTPAPSPSQGPGTGSNPAASGFTQISPGERDPEPQITYAPPTQEQYATGASPIQQQPASEEKKSRKGLLWTALAVVVALIAAAAVYFFVIRGDDSSGDNEAGGSSSSEARPSDDESAGSSGSGESGESSESGSSGSESSGGGELSTDQQTQVAALYDDYTQAWMEAAKTGDITPVAAYAVEHAHPDFKPDQAQCLSYFQANGATKGYRQTFKVDMSTVQAAPDWTPPGASDKPSGDVYSATAEHFAGPGLVINPQQIEVHFAIVDDKAYMFPTCS